MGRRREAIGMTAPAALETENRIGRKLSAYEWAVLVRLYRDDNRGTKWWGLPKGGRIVAYLRSLEPTRTRRTKAIAKIRARINAGSKERAPTNSARRSPLANSLRDPLSPIRLEAPVGSFRTSMGEHELSEQYHSSGTGTTRTRSVAEEPGFEGVNPK